jgi:hypothetical protein
VAADGDTLRIGSVARSQAVPTTTPPVWCGSGRVHRPRHVAAVLLAFLSVLTVFVAPATAANEGGGPLTETSDGPLVRAGVQDSVIRLYGAVFDRDPDQAGLDHWVGEYVAGRPLASIAAAFMSGPEWAATYGDVDDAAFIDLLYGNVLGRLADPDGRSYWAGRLAGNLSRAALLVGFSESPEYVFATDTQSPVPPVPADAFPPLPAGSGRRVVYSNSLQRVWWVTRYDVVVESYAVSGRRGEPSAGTYKVYSKSVKAWAGHDGITMNHMIRFARGETLAIGFHAIPRYPDGTPLQTEDELGGYRSAGCVRQADADAAALFAWAEVGTKVVVTR